jgi:hypothetical protein
MNEISNFQSRFPELAQLLNCTFNGESWFRCSDLVVHINLPGVLVEMIQDYTEPLRVGDVIEKPKKITGHHLVLYQKGHSFRCAPSRQSSSEKRRDGPHIVITNNEVTSQPLVLALLRPSETFTPFHFRQEQKEWWLERRTISYRNLPQLVIEFSFLERLVAALSLVPSEVYFKINDSFQIDMRELYDMFTQFYNGDSSSDDSSDSN